MTDRGCQDSRLHTVTTGMMFLVSGGVLLAAARGWFTFEQGWRWWPLGMLCAAAHHLTAPAPERSLTAAAGWTAAAGLGLLWTHAYISLRLPVLVPLFFILAGIWVLYSATRPAGRRS